MTDQDFSDYMEASALHDRITTDQIAHAERKRLAKGGLDTNLFDRP